MDDDPKGREAWTQRFVQLALLLAVLGVLQLALGDEDGAALRWVAFGGAAFCALAAVILKAGAPD